MSSSIIRVEIMSKLGTTLTVDSNCTAAQLVVTANVVPSWLILCIQVIEEAIRSTETSVLTRTTRHHIPEGSILQPEYSRTQELHLPLTV
jgi:hypothetical protein